jgi:hypothetical protein
MRLPWLNQGWEYMGTINRGHFSTLVPAKDGGRSWHPIMNFRKRSTPPEPPSVSSCSIHRTAHEEHDHYLWLSFPIACATSASCGELNLHFPQLEEDQLGNVIQFWEYGPMRHTKSSKPVAVSLLPWVQKPKASIRPFLH